MKVLIVDVSSRALAQSAVAAGYEVISLDFFGDSDQPPQAEVYSLVRDFQRPPLLSELAQAAQELEPRAEAIVVGAGLENEPALLNLKLHGKRWFNSPAAVKGARDLRWVSEALTGTGVEIPEIVLPTERLPKTGRWLVKDLTHSGGTGVGDWNGASPLEPGQVLQHFIAGDLASASFVADSRRAMLLGVTRQFAGVEALKARPYAWCGNVAPYGGEALEKILRAAACRLAQAFGLVGLNGMDFILKDGVPYLLEVNPRPGASCELFERLLGVNVFSLHVDGCEGRLPTAIPPAPPHTAWGKGILYAGRDLRVADTRPWAGQGIADVPHSGEEIPAGAPVCSLLAQGQDAEDCWQNVLGRAAALSA